MNSPKPDSVAYRLSLLSLASIGLSFLVSCAHVSFHPDADLKQKTGLKYYTAKPYLLVSFTGAKDNPVKIDTISLPDLEHPTYAVYHRGWGQHIFNLAVGTNGTLSSYGQTADSKGPETITALGSLLSSAGSAASGFGAAAKAFRGESKQLDQAKTNVQNAIGDLRGITTMTADPNGLVADKAQKAGDLVKDLQAIVTALDNGDFNQQRNLTKISGEIDNLKVPDAVGNPVAVKINSSFKDAQTDIQSAIDVLKESGYGPPPKPDFRLFEIRMEAGTTKLIPVNTEVAKTIIREFVAQSGK